MRLIETKMNKAIRRGGNFSNGNTSVQTVSYLDSQDVYREESKVFLHGNHIATYDHTSKELSLFDGGWQSNTTKSRLNALLSEFTYNGLSLVQRNWSWFLRDNDFTNKALVPFVSGMTVWNRGKLKGRWRETDLF